MVENCQCAEGETVETVVRTIISGNQLNIYGALSDLCEECKTCHVRARRPVVDNLTHCLCQQVDEDTHTFDR